MHHRLSTPKMFRVAAVSWRTYEALKEAVITRTSQLKISASGS